MMYRIKSDSGFGGVTVATDDPKDALARARELEEQGLQNVVILDQDDLARSSAEFQHMIMARDGTPSASIGSD